MREKENSNNKIFVEQIIEEINYYSQTEVENYELKNILNNFTQMLIYCKCRNTSDFAFLIFDLLKKELTDSTDNFISSIYSLATLIEQRKNNFKEVREDQIQFASIIKTLMTESICVLRPDVLVFLEKIYK